MERCGNLSNCETDRASEVATGGAISSRDGGRRNRFTRGGGVVVT